MSGLLNYSIEENLGRGATAGLSGLGVDEDLAEKIGPWLAMVPQFIPFVGAGVGIDNTVRALNDGNYKDAAIEAGLTALGEIPIFGDLGANALRSIRGQTGVLGMTGKEAAEQARIPEIRRSTEDERLRGGMSDATGEYTSMGKNREQAMLESSAGRTREEIARANNFETVVEDTFDLNKLPVLTSDDLSGGVFIPMRGDPTLAGNMTQASGVPIRELELQSGPVYPLKSQIERPDPAAWESTDVVARGFHDKAGKVSKDAQTDNVWGVYDMMDMPSSNFSTMPVEAILREMETIRDAGGKYPQGIIDEIDAAVRAAEVKKKKVFEDFPGILSPDAEAPLLELDPAATYVVGGLVDRSVVQHATTDRARACGATAVRLPLREFAPRSDVHTILNVVDVVQMLAARHSGRSWEEAIADHVPQRFVDRREREERQRREL